MEKFNHEKILKTKEQYLSLCLDCLKKLYNDFSSEIPVEVIHSDNENANYKCRAAWWSSVSLNIGLLQKNNLLPDKYINEYNNIFNSHVKVLEENNNLTQPENIKEIDDFLLKVINYLEKK